MFINFYINQLKKKILGKIKVTLIVSKIEKQ